MAKVYKVDTGLTNPDTVPFRDTLFNILNLYFPGLLQKVDNSSDLKSIAGIGLYNCGVGFRSYSSRMWTYDLYNSNQNNQLTIYNTNDNSGSICIYHVPIKNGVLISICGSNDDYTKYMFFAFLKESNNHVKLYKFKENDNTKEIMVNDLMVNGSIVNYSSFLEGSPIVDSSKICMSKLILGNDIIDGVYIASCSPVVSTISQSFIIDDKEYVTASQPNGYCPLVFEID